MMTEETVVSETPTEKKSLLERSRMNDRSTLMMTILYALVGAVLYIILQMIPHPFIAMGLLKFGLLPPLAIIALVGAIRGPVAGFLSGYLGEVLYGLVMYNTIVSMTLDAASFGVIGLIVGLTTYDLKNGRSLIKLSILSVIGLVFSVLLIVVIAMKVEVYGTLAILGFEMLPLLTLGIPTLLFLTPVLARIWAAFDTHFSPNDEHPDES